MQGGSTANGTYRDTTPVADSEPVMRTTEPGDAGASPHLADAAFLLPDKLPILSFLVPTDSSNVHAAVCAFLIPAHAARSAFHRTMLPAGKLCRQGSDQIELVGQEDAPSDLCA